MLLSSDDRYEVSNFAEKFETDVNRFEVQFEKEFKVDKEGFKLEVTKYSLDDGLKVSINNG